MAVNQPSFQANTAYPVILGAGLTGVAISGALSAAGITHVLVGDPPSQTPRLGESLNTEGSLEIARQFPALMNFCFPKKQQALFFGGNAISFDSIQYAQGHAYYRLLGYPATVQLLHVDRVGFDTAAFPAAIADPHCMFLEDRAVSLDYDPPSDWIRGVLLASGKSVLSSYVFDATNHARFVARQVGVRCKLIGKPRRVAFAHYSALGDRAAAPAQQPNWIHATSLLRLDLTKDPVDGLAWTIPLGSYVSVGISVDPRNTGAAAGGLLDWVEKAFARRGMDVRRDFPTRGTPVDLRYEHYNHERCYGQNWLLAGMSCCQVWFPSAAGVATGLVAARLAADVLKAPVRAAQVYQLYIDEVAAIHAGLEWLVRDDPWPVTLQQLQQRTQAMVSGNVLRLGDYVALRNPPDELAFGDAALRLFERDRRLASPVRIATALPQSQATRLFAATGQPDPWTDAPIAVPVVTRPDGLRGPMAILGLVDILSGRLGTEASAGLVTADVKVEIDQFQLTGAAQWNSWVTFLRGAARVNELELVPAALEASGAEWVLTAQWQGLMGAEGAVSPQLTMNFQMSGDKVSEIRMQRADCTFAVGDEILPQVAFAVVVGRLAAAGARQTPPQ
ncbi:MAG: hypothetical protein P4L56_03840 [Candidatus Sulfopaludibacter sp.]|nr:hypothetical protein [Candidatus Sulfopaludibacter sp.]